MIKKKLEIFGKGRELALNSSNFAVAKVTNNKKR